MWGRDEGHPGALPEPSTRGWALGCQGESPFPRPLLIARGLAGEVPPAPPRGSGRFGCDALRSSCETGGAGGVQVSGWKAAARSIPSRTLPVLPSCDFARAQCQDRS